MVYFLTETFRENSVKMFERLDRGSSNILVGGVGPGSLRPIGTAWNSAMHSNEFKTTLQQQLLEQFQADSHALALKGRKLYFTLDNACFLLECSPSNKVECKEVDDMYCDHEEPDTKVIYYASKIPSGLRTVVIKIADTDVVVNAVHHSPNIHSELLILWGTKEYRKVFSAQDIREKIGDEMSEALVGLHVITGNGKVSAICGMGKVNPFKKVMKSSRLKKAFTDLGATGKPSEENFTDLDEAMCVLYGRPKCTSIDKARWEKFNEVFEMKVTKEGKPKVKGMAESRIPMPFRVLMPHIKRAMRDAYVQKMANHGTPSIPHPVECGYQLSSNNELKIQWVAGSPFPSFITREEQGSKSNRQEQNEEDEIQNENIDGTETDEAKDDSGESSDSSESDDENDSDSDF